MSLKQVAEAISELKAEILQAVGQLEIDAKSKELESLDARVADSSIWNDVEKAQALIRKTNNLRAQIEPWQVLRTQIVDLDELLKEMADESLEQEFTSQLKGLQEDFKKLKTDLLFSGEYDDHNVILKISSGAGGTEAQDWASMLERMYLRWCERSNVKAELIDRSVGEEAGIKSATYGLSGVNVYGRMRGEHGVHRLVRLSPFNADNLRQTSFALVEILPDIDTPDEVVVAPEDLKIDVFRAGGHGGQSVNTTDSAVRITHLPTGLVVAIKNERSQLQNREKAMQILRSKLIQMQLEQSAASISELKATESASWGAQIRNYVMHPYTMVKDTRTKYEEKDVTAVLDGKINEFMMRYLEWSVANSLK